MDDGSYKAFSQYAGELERLRQVNAVLLEACKLALPELEGYARRNPNDNNLNMPIRALETAINLAEGKE